MAMRDEQICAIDAEARRLRVLTDSIVDGLAIVSAGGMILEANLRLGELLDQDARSLAGRRLASLVSDGHQAALEALVAAEEQAHAIEVALAGPHAVSAEVHVRRADLVAGPVTIVTFHDLRARRSAEEKIGRRARHDPLTGLRNRLGLDQALAAEQTRAERYGANFAVLCLDLDGFKAINDSHGHAAGDEALRVVARRLEEVTRETDLVFRLGGDEFLILQAYTTEPHQSSRLAERLVEAVGRPFFVGDVPVNLGISIGIAHFPNHGRVIEELLHNADAALYKAKREGKNTHRFFDPSLDQSLQHRRTIEAELMHAIDRGELELVYDPELEIATGAVVGFGVRLSWNSSRLGTVPPAVFLPIAEHAGLMTALGEWTIHDACRQASTWTRPLGIAVAISLFQLKSSDMAITVVQALKVSGLAPARLRIDVSEAALIQGGKMVSETLAKLGSLEIRLGLDEFGTGASSIAAMDGGTFHFVKLAPAFAEDDESLDRRRLAIVAACRVFGLPVGATAVGSSAMRDRLVDAGVSLIQGDVVSPPGAIARFAPFVGTTSPALRKTGDARALDDVRELLDPFHPELIPVLIVDDSDIVGETLSAMLEAFGFTDVRCATDGAAAWDLLRRQPFGLVISDWNMAPVSGIELLRRIRADPGLGHIQFLMLTANARSASRIAARDAGVDGFLVKPFRPDALASKIRDVLAIQPRLDRVG